MMEGQFFETQDVRQLLDKNVKNFRSLQSYSFKEKWTKIEKNCVGSSIFMFFQLIQLYIGDAK